MHLAIVREDVNNGEIEARRLLKIGFAPADWLYSESLTKVTKGVAHHHHHHHQNP
jgi:hypothetical protein